MTDEIIKQVDKNALAALKVAAAENDHVKSAVKTTTALKLVAKSSELEKQKFDQTMATKKHELDLKKHDLEIEKVQIQKELDAEKLQLQRDLEEQKRIDMIHQREAQEKLEEQNRMSQERLMMTKAAIDALGGVLKVASGVGMVAFGVNYEEKRVIGSEFVKWAIRQVPNPFRKG